MYNFTNMKFEKLSFQKQYCIRLDKGDEIIEALTNFCKKNKITSGSFSGIGATNNLIIGCFNLQTKKYDDKQFDKSLEILSLLGNISLSNNNPFVHAHIIISDEKFNTFGGHLKKCVISLTCEIYLNVYKQKIKRIPNGKLGISILNFNK